jgi:hypothetical protein
MAVLALTLAEPKLNTAKPTIAPLAETCEAVRPIRRALVCVPLAMSRP